MSDRDREEIQSLRDFLPRVNKWRKAFMSGEM